MTYFRNHVYRLLVPTVGVLHSQVKQNSYILYRRMRVYVERSTSSHHLVRHDSCRQNPTFGTRTRLEIERFGLPNDHQSTAYEYPTQRSTAQSKTSGAMYGLVPDIDVARWPSSRTVAMLKSVKWAWPKGTDLRNVRIGERVFGGANIQQRRQKEFLFKIFTVCGIATCETLNGFCSNNNGLDCSYLGLSMVWVMFFKKNKKMIERMLCRIKQLTNR